MKRNWWYLVCYAVIKRFDYVIDEIHTLRLIAVWYICLNIILVVVVVVVEEEEEEEDEECRLSGMSRLVSQCGVFSHAVNLRFKNNFVV